MHHPNFEALVRLLNWQLQYAVLSGMIGKVEGGIVKEMILEVKVTFLQEVTYGMRTKRFKRGRQVKLEEVGGEYDSSRENVMGKL